jgi:predicted ATP-grasp superfamily ATP-dependent carboligase
VTRAARVLLTDGEARWVLAAARGLRAAGYDVRVAASSRRAITLASSACARTMILPDPHEDGERFVAALEAELAADPVDILVPGNEASLRAVSGYRGRIEGRCRIDLPPHQVVVDALDKVTAVEHADAVGFAPPPSTRCDSLDDAIEAAREQGFPVMVKPSSSQLPSGRGLRGQTSILVGTPDELADAVSTVGVPFVVQRYLTGTHVLSVGGVATDTGLAAVAVARYVRTWPELAGSASFSETIVPPPGLLASVDAFVRQIGWRGIFELELLEAGHERALIDVNPRMYGSLALAIVSGANLPAIWCDRLRGVTGPLVVAEPGHRYRFEAAEANNALARLRQHRWREAASIALPHRNVVHAIFSLRDPAPFLVDLRNRRRKATSAQPHAGVPVGAGR